MSRLFGTDGVRGLANSEISVELAVKIGRAAATVLAKGRTHQTTVLIGKDTRISSDMLENSIAAGLCSIGANVICIGEVPTPAVAYLVRRYNADAGVMISASHNPYAFNGIKIFSGDGFKLPDELEDQIESLILQDNITLAKDNQLGTVQHNKDMINDYIDYIKGTVSGDLSGIKIAVDCSNGSSSKTAVKLFEYLNADVTFLSNQPNGTNINDNCGSTHLNNLSDYVKTNGCDIGIAFDGDADRCLLVDENGNDVDGDFIMAICAKDLKEQGRLNKNALVGTVMSNMGLIKFCEENGIKYVSTKVGDRYVLEEMELEDYSIGGEQSGHIIFREFATTGDGQLTALQVLSLIKRSGESLSKITSQMKKYPQYMQNITVTKDGKVAFYNNEAVKNAIEKGKEQLKNTGRIVARVSGTEPLIRIMAEGENLDEIIKIVSEISQVVKNELA